MINTDSKATIPLFTSSSKFCGLCAYVGLHCDHMVFVPIYIIYLQGDGINVQIYDDKEIRNFLFAYARRLDYVICSVTQLPNNDFSKVISTYSKYVCTHPFKLW